MFIFRGFFLKRGAHEVLLIKIESMQNFSFQNPTKLMMGRGMIAQLAQEIPADKRVLITFGGGSVKSNGVYE